MRENPGRGAPPGRTIFITGTDTGVGKTTVTCGLLRAARDAHLDATGFKPVASGSRRTPAGLRNADALALMRAAAMPPSLYDRVNPAAFARPIAPHLAARDEGRRIDPRKLDAAHAWLAARHDLVLVEGAGGWMVPLTERLTSADWVARHGWPVILVVGLRLGCINHALLSAEAIARRAPLLGWIANGLPPAQPERAANIDSLAARLPAPLLGTLAPGRGADGPVFDRILVRLQGFG